MKSINLLAIFFFLIFASCSDDDSITPDQPSDPLAPSIELLEGDISTLKAVVGSPQTGTVNSKIKVHAPAGFKALAITRVSGNTETDYAYFNTDSPEYDGSGSLTYSLNYNFAPEDIDNEVYFKAVVKDINDESASIEFAKAIVKSPMVVSTLAMGNTTDGDVGPGTKAYVFYDQSTTKVMKYLTVTQQIAYANIEIVFSYNNDSGPYLSSTLAVLEQDMVDVFSESVKSRTKFKKVENFGVDAFNQLNKYDHFKIVELYENSVPTAHQQRTEWLEKDQIFSYKLDDDRVGIFLVKKIEKNGSDLTLEVKTLTTK